MNDKKKYKNLKEILKLLIFISWYSFELHIYLNQPYIFYSRLINKFSILLYLR